MRRNIFIREWIESIPKIIDSNKCWIPTNKAPNSNGYILIMFNYKNYYLHRVILSVYYNIDYTNITIQARHSTGCSRKCFNPEHIQPGTNSDNQQDAVRDKTHWGSKKEVCQTCKGPFTTYKYKSGPLKGKIKRRCNSCRRNKS